MSEKTVAIKMSLNSETEEVQVFLDDELLASSGKDLFVAWVNWYNEKHKPVPTVAEPVVEVVETPAPPVVEPTLDTPVTPVVD